MIDWKKLCEDSDRIARDKGWLDIKRGVPGDLFLMHSELSEALEDYRNHKGLNEIYYEDKGGTKFPSLELAQKTSLDPSKTFKPCGIPIEMADFAIRICQFCGSNGINLAYAMHMYKHTGATITDFELLGAKLHSCISKVFDYWADKDGVGAAGVDEYQFARALNYLIDFCNHHKIDLAGAIGHEASVQ
jgi:hypothetical protein